MLFCFIHHKYTSLVKDMQALFEKSEEGIEMIYILKIEVY